MKNLKTFIVAVLATVMAMPAMSAGEWPNFNNVIQNGADGTEFPQAMERAIESGNVVSLNDSNSTFSAGMKKNLFQRYNDGSVPSYDLDQLNKVDLQRALEENIRKFSCQLYRHENNQYAVEDCDGIENKDFQSAKQEYPTRTSAIETSYRGSRKALFSYDVKIEQEGSQSHPIFQPVSFLKGYFAKGGMSDGDLVLTVIFTPYYQTESGRRDGEALFSEAVYIVIPSPSEIKNQSSAQEAADFTVENSKNQRSAAQAAADFAVENSRMIVLEPSDLY